MRRQTLLGTILRILTRIKELLGGTEFAAAKGGNVAEPAYPRSRHDYSSDAEELERLDAAMDGTPRGAVLVSAIAVGLLLLCWFGIYLFVFLPRGTVG